MAGEAPTKLYIGIAKDGDVALGHTVSVGTPLLYEDSKEVKKGAADEPNKAPVNSDVTFAQVFGSFVKSMEAYRSFIALTLTIAPHLSTIVAASEISKFASSKGTRRGDLSSPTTTIYELDIGCFREYEVCESRVASAMAGADHLPEAMIIGLVSVFDAFLSQLLRAVFNLHPEIVLTSEREIKFSDLVKFKSIEDARRAIIDREIDAVLRMSHDEHFEWMQNKFKIPLKSDLPIWPKFIELCERRNLLTHTGGIVSPQYLQNGQKHKFDVSKCAVGTKLGIDASYYKSAVSIVYEIGIKLCSVFWRKFADSEREMADKALNDLGFDLISHSAYDIAEVFLKFGTSALKKHHSEMGRRMMIINLANAILLQKRKPEAVKLLDKEDWSASSNNFLICVATIKGDMDEVLRLMDEIGSDGLVSKENYRSWPVFRSVKSDERFIAKFAEIFKEPYTVPEVIEVGVKDGVKLGVEMDAEVVVARPRPQAIEGRRAVVADESLAPTPETKH